MFCKTEGMKAVVLGGKGDLKARRITDQAQMPTRKPLQFSPRQQAAMHGCMPTREALLLRMN